MGRHHTRLVRVAALLGLVLAGAGCQAGSSSAGAPSSSSDTVTTSASATPTVAPASGPLLTIRPATVHAPAGYKLVPSSLPFGQSASEGATGRQVLLSYLPVQPGTIDDLVASSSRGGLWKQRPQRLADVTVAGQTWYHLMGPSKLYAESHEYGTYRDGNVVWLSVSSFRGSVDQGVIDQVLASLVWRS